MREQIPWGINTIGSLYHPDCQAEIQVDRQGTIYTGWVAAVCVPCPPSLRERFRAAWWVFTGRAHAFLWPMAGDLEAIWTRDNPTLRVRAASRACHLKELIEEYARDLRRNSSGGDGYPLEYAKATADYLETLISRAALSNHRSK